jgi:hypothetical protein
MGKINAENVKDGEREVNVKVLLLVGTMLLSSCTLWDLIKPGDGPALAVDTEIVAGDKNQTVETNVGETTNNQAAEEITIENNYTDYWLVIIAILGWISPTPTTIWKWFTNLFFMRNKDA